MPKGYWLATYKKIESKDNLGNYAAKATETIKSYGENPLVRGGKYRCLEGNDFSRTVIWKFPTYETNFINFVHVEFLYALSLLRFTSTVFF